MKTISQYVADARHANHLMIAARRQGLRINAYSFLRSRADAMHRARIAKFGTVVR